MSEGSLPKRRNFSLKLSRPGTALPPMVTAASSRGARASPPNSAVERTSARRLIGLLSRSSRGPKPLTLERWAAEIMLRIFAILVTLSTCSVARAEDFAPVSAEERAALIALFNGTGGPSWKNRAGWLGPAGSECHWYGVTCGLAGNGTAPRNNVWALELEENNLSGSLPPEMSDLQGLEQLFLWGNRLTGSLPGGLRDRWLAGPLRLIGYASQFTAQVEEITLTRRSVAQCGDMVAIIRTNGTASSRMEKCRERRKKVDVYCEVRAGRTDLFAQDLDRLVYFMETSGFFALRSEYRRSMTHGGTTEIEVLRAGERIKVVNFGAFGPQQLWMTERLLQGILDETTWDDLREIRDCGFTRRDV